MPDPDLLTPLLPPSADAARLPGTIDGPPGWSEGLLAGLRAWCGPAIGWRDVGELRGAGVGCIAHQHGRLMLSLTFDLGPHSFPRRPREETEDEGCPVGDPGCLSGDGDCHDACERPDG